jgi:hypothetical protein
MVVLEQWLANPPVAWTAGTLVIPLCPTVMCLFFVFFLVMELRSGEKIPAKHLLQFAVATLLFGGMAFLCFFLVLTEPTKPQPTDEERAAKTIFNLGGYVVKDKTLPGEPVVKVGIDSKRWDGKTFVTIDFGDIGLQNMEPFLLALPHLQELDLWNAKITDKGLNHLRRLGNLKTLRLPRPARYPTDPTPSLTESGVEDLRWRLPKTKIVFEYSAGPRLRQPLPLPPPEDFIKQLK